MKRQITTSFLQELRDLYTPGTRVRLLKMDDSQAPPIGTLGTIDHVDDIGTIHVRWENGSSLGVAWGEDKVELVDKVITICYHERKVWESREQAKEFYVQAMVSSEGSERERYYNILCDLMLGFTVCRDKK